jgi:NAD+ diphosphatase
MAALPLEALGFCGGELNRSANFRSDDAWLAEKRRDSASRLIRLQEDRVRLVDDALVYEPVPNDGELLFLGLDPQGCALFAAEARESLTDSIDLRSLAIQAALPRRELAMLAQARSLLAWHKRRGFCSNCGAKTEIRDAGYRRHCPTCKMDHFPRTDPVVIIIVRSAKGLLLGRQSFWPKGMYSALAGFMEPGETIEEAARREVFEEAGIRVGRVTYIASQPWPFPSSLMIGLLGEAETDDIQIDAKELEDARWFSPKELLFMRDGQHPQELKFPVKMAIAHHLVLAAIESQLNHSA